MGAEPIVTIHLTAPLRPYAGGASRLEIAAPTVKAALGVLERSQTALYRNLCDETGALRRHLNVFVNADSIRDLGGLDTTLAAGDVVTFLPAVSGG
jgi:sulfur-carrier protein